MPCAQLRRKKGADLPHSEEREVLIGMDNYNNIELFCVFSNKLTFFLKYILFHILESFFTCWFYLSQ